MAETLGSPVDDRGAPAKAVWSVQKEEDVGSGPEGQVGAREAGGGQTDRQDALAGRWDKGPGDQFNLQGTQRDTQGSRSRAQDTFTFEIWKKTKAAKGCPWEDLFRRKRGECHGAEIRRIRYFRK